MSDRTLPNRSDVWLQTLGWQPTSEQEQQFERLFQQILQANQQLNLTRITDPQDFWEKHLWDSLVGIAPWLPPGSPIPTWLQDLASLSTDLNQPMRVIDIGTGGGFPGLPIAIIKPTWPITLLDSTQKKLTFLDQATADLGLENVEGCCDRAENLGQQSPYRESFDLALVRAVGPASVCAEYALPLLALQGYAVLYRGQWTTEEQEGLKAVASKLGGEVVAVLPVTMPHSPGIRHCIYLRKTQPTDPKFPRRVGVPARKPL
ncbi:16S rRNA (guanine(527)-N(7))-methyltransferase RsmG [Acaryochloris marina NIES-2412]|uniref:16S rRNA (guanine(527)-N(7))-methyltransferase RsmG n=1 Tax=Acaryochloris marina TaxID=155978 RepID=UPI00405A2E03